MTNRFRFTKKDLAKVETPDRGRVRVYDTEVRGFGMSVTAGGSRRYFMRRMVRNREVTRDLGAVEDQTVEQARDAALAARRDIAATAGMATGKVTLGALWEVYSERHLPTLQPRTVTEYTRIWKRHLHPYRMFPLREIGRANLASLHVSICDRHGVYIANRTLAVVSSMFGLAVSRGMMAASPPMPKKYPETKRRRWLDRQELARLLAVLYSTDQDELDLSRQQERFTAITGHQKSYFLLLLFTGARRSEVAAMRWDQVDLAGGVWMRVQKGGAVEPTVLAAPAVEILESLPRDGQYVFPGSGKTGHLVEPKSAWARVCARAQITGARIHDLRHTHASWMAQAGVSLQIIGGQLGHKQTATTERYSHLTLDPIRRAVEAVVAEMRGA